MWTHRDLEVMFTYHAPQEDQVPSFEAIRAAGFHLAKTIVSHTPDCGDQMAAIRKVREAVMTANAAIALRGTV